MKKLISVILCAALCLCLLSACNTAKPGATAGQPVKASDNSWLNNRRAAAAATYSEVFKALSASRGVERGGGTMTAGAVAEDSAAAESEAPKALTSEAAVADSDAGSYSGTNVQVSGVDEGDVVKTDGRYIYVLRSNELIILLADGENTKKLSSITVCAGDISDKNEVTSDDSGYSYENEYANELYISGDRAVVTTTYYSYIETKNGDAYSYENTDSANVYIYDIADRESPLLLGSGGQDGYVSATRLLDGVLYMVSSYSVYDYTEDDPETFIPRVYAGGSASLVAGDCIVVMPGVVSSTYAVISSYNLETAQRVDTKSVLGGSSSVYMNGDSLFIACSKGENNDGEPYTDGIYKVVDHAYRDVTDITRFDVAAGTVSFAASGSVEGYLLNQFSMDEYDGHLRVVTTNSSSSWSEYTDEENGWTNYKYDEDGGSMTNALYVLDGNLSVTGSITGLAEDERVYSVRFDGDTGYFVTFRNVDPLFAVNLSDPAAPKLLSSLKIPGFSEYLHVYGDGLLFGLGMNADPETGSTDCLKLSMFDVSDKANVTEKHTLKLEDCWYSEALYNHKAMFIVPEMSIIGFPTDGAFRIYGYSADDGFYLRAEVADLDWSYNTRGMYIGGEAYVVSESRITVLSLTDFTPITDIDF